MNKIKQEFEKWFRWEIEIDDNHVGEGNYYGGTLMSFDSFKAGYKSHDKETNKLREALRIKEAEVRRLLEF